MQCGQIKFLYQWNYKMLLVIELGLSQSPKPHILICEYQTKVYFKQHNVYNWLHLGKSMTYLVDSERRSDRLVLCLITKMKQLRPRKSKIHPWALEVCLWRGLDWNLGIVETLFSSIKCCCFTEPNIWEKLKLFLPPWSFRGSPEAIFEPIAN